MHLILLVLILVCGAWGQGLWATEQEESLAAALRSQIGSIEFSQKQLDRGLVKQGEELIFEFPYKVSPTGPVTLLGVHQECGCLTQSLKVGQVLEAGKQGLLTIRADTRFFTGSFNKSVTLLTNQESGGAVVLRLKAQIEKILSLQPPLIELNLSSLKSAKQMATVRIQKASKQRLHIEKVAYNKDTLDVSYYPVQDAWELKIKWIGPLPTKPWFESIEVTTDSSVKVLKIPVVEARKTNKL